MKLFTPPEEDLQALDRALQQLEEAERQHEEAVKLCDELQREHRQNHYAELIRQALSAPTTK